MKITKSNLVQSVYNTTDGLTKTDAVKAVELFLQITKDTLINNSDVLLSGFGKFSIKDKASRRGRNPKTGEDLILNPRQVVTFKCSGLLRDRVNVAGTNPK